MASDDVVVGGRYQLGSLLGRGGMAEVHEAYDQRLGRPVAVKQLSPHLAADPDAHLRFDREAHAVASLNHPAIAAVFDTGEDTDQVTGASTPYIVMELVEGETLRDRLRRTGPLPAEEALSITARVLDALRHSHAAGIIHRDIKPSNVMLTSSGAVKVMDFGIARAVDDTSGGLTQSAVVIGTVAYLSPEQASGHAVDPRSDLYSVGCMLYELLTGRPPFVGDSHIAVAYQHVRESAAPPSSLNPVLDPAIDAVVMRALAKNPEDRYQTAADMLDALDRLRDRRDESPTAVAAVPPLEADLVPTLAAAAVPAEWPPTPTAMAAPEVARVAPAAVPLAMVAPAAVPPVVGPPAAPPPAAPPPAEEDRRRPFGAGRVALIAAACVVAIGLVILAVNWVLPGDRGSVAVPAVTGERQATAEAMLREVGLEPEIKKVHGKAGTTVGIVSAQTPAAGRQVARSSIVTLEVNVGPATATIPRNLVGAQIQQAEAALEAAGFTDVTARAVSDPTGKAKAGEVLSVDPKEGGSAALDDPIVLNYVGDVPAGQSTKPTTKPTSKPTSRPAKTATAEPTRTTAPSAEPSSSPPASAEPSPSAKPSRSASPGRSAGAAGGVQGDE